LEGIGEIRRDRPVDVWHIGWRRQGIFIGVRDDGLKDDLGQHHFRGRGIRDGEQALFAEVAVVNELDPVAARSKAAAARRNKAIGACGVRNGLSERPERARRCSEDEA
jgi:hypothetical protein